MISLSPGFEAPSGCVERSLTYIIPIHDDLESAQDLLLEIKQLPPSPYLKFLIVENGVTKGASLRSMFEAENLRNLRVESVEENQGFGGGILAGLSKVDTSHVGWMPGNLKIRVRESVKIWESYKMDLDSAALKCRRIRTSTRDSFKTALAGLATTIIYRANTFDSGGTPTVLKLETMRVIGKHAPKGYDFELFVLYCLRRMGVSVVRPNINYGLRRYGSSKWQKGLASEAKLLLKLLTQKKKWDEVLCGRSG